MTESPDRVTVSLPPDDDLDADTIDELVEQSEYDDRSKFIRAAIREQL